MRRGEVWWGQLPPPIGRRPVVLLSRDSAYRVRSAVTIAPITRTIRNIPVEVALDEADGLPARCVANLDDMATIPKALIKRRIAVLSAEKMHEVEAAGSLLTCRDGRDRLTPPRAAGRRPPRPGPRD